MKRNRGSVTIEATLSLTTFLFFFIMLYNLLIVCITQARVSEAINNTAKELSQYSYLIGKTGLDRSIGNIQNQAQNNRTEVNENIKNVAQVYSAMTNIKNDAQNTVADMESFDVDTIVQGSQELKRSIEENGAQAQSAMGQLEETFTQMANDPRTFILGIGQIGASEVFEIFKSKYVAGPLALGLSKKHLRTSEGESDAALEETLKRMRIVPGTKNGTTSYIKGLDFSQSTIFPYGSDEITIAVKYKIKIIPLLPVDLEYEVCQKATTKGWMHGDGKQLKIPSQSNSGSQQQQQPQQPQQMQITESIWNGSNPSEINRFIRNQAITSYKQEGYKSISGRGATYAQVYNSDTNTFLMVSSSNPLFGEVNTEALNDETTKNQIKEQIERLSAGVKSSCEQLDTVTVKYIGDGGTKKEDVKSGENKKYELVLVVPEDEGVKALYEEVLKDCNTKGVHVTFEASYGRVLEKASE